MSDIFNPSTLTVDNNGTIVGAEQGINFIPGANISISTVDNPLSNRVDVTIASTGSGGGGVTSLDAITGAITLVAGSGINITDNSPSAGDITIAVTGSGPVAYNDITSVPADTILGNNTGSTANAIALTAAQVNTLLGTSGGPFVPYTGATGAVDLNNQTLGDVGELFVGSAIDNGSGAVLQVSGKQTIISSASGPVLSVVNNNAAVTTVFNIQSNTGQVFQTLTAGDGSIAYLYQRTAATGLAGFTSSTGFSVDIYGSANSIAVFKNNGDVALGGTITSPTTYAGAKMFINGTSGDVGIGTVSPLESLHIDGGAIEVSSPNSSAITYATRANSLLFTRNDIPASNYNKISNSWSGVTANNTMNFEVDNGSGTAVTVLSLTGNGRINLGAPGVGAYLTSTNADVLIGNGVATSLFRLLPFGNDIFFDNTANGNIVFRTNEISSVVTLMTLLSNGNALIGTTTDNGLAQLQVANQGTFNSSIAQTAGNNPMSYTFDGV